MTGGETPAVKAGHSRLNLWPLGLVVVILGFAFFGDRGILLLLKMTQQKAALVQELEQVNLQNDSLRQEISSLRNDRRYIEKLARTTINLQYICAGEPLLHGAFIGEDLAERYDKTSKPRDYVDLRVTSYAVIALAKIAAENSAQWSPVYSVFGWG